MNSATLIRRILLRPVVLAFLLFLVVRTDSPGQIPSVAISGGVVNSSLWENDPTITPPHFFVFGDLGEPTLGEGRAMLGLYLEVLGLDFPISTLYLEPTNIFNLASVPMGAGNWLFEFPDMTYGQTYILRAWIDGNNNRSYDVGEPVGSRQLTPFGDSVGNIVFIRDDSDSDGLEDWWEVHWFGDLAQTAGNDYDNDGISNIDERNLINGPFPDLRPNDWDSDGDGMDDGWELSYDLDPTSTTGIDGATGDPDGDTLNNLFEYRGPDGTGPKASGFFGIAIDTGSTDTLNPRSRDTDDDSVDDNVEVLYDLTHPAHSMSSTNYLPRSLAMTVNGGAGVPLADPVGGLYAFGEGGGTVEFWIYPQSNTTDGLIYYFPSAAAGDDHFRISLVDRRPKMEILTGTNVFSYVGGDPGSVEQLPIGEWSHVAFVWAPDNNSLDLFVDGLLLIAQKIFAKFNFTVGPPSILSGFTDGYLDELRVWDYARTKSDIEHWSQRIYPAPGYVQTHSRTAGGLPIFNYEFGIPLRAYFRFDDSGETIENFAFLNNTNYALDATVSAAVTGMKAAAVFGSDDADGDGVPEWWASLHSLEKYPEYYSTAFGPFYVPCEENPLLVLDFEYFRSFVAYGSIGNSTAWFDDPENTESFFRTPKTQLDFDEGVHSSFMKYVYLDTQPVACSLELFTPGMVSTIVFINGEQVTPDSNAEDTLQVLDTTAQMHLGRNMIYVRCESDFFLSTDPASRYGTDQEYRDYDASLPDPVLGCEETPYLYKHATGKFDARLTCNGRDLVVRGDESRADPRSVWHCQFWSTGSEDFGHSYFPIPDEELRYLPGNQDYGVPSNAERDNNPLDPDLADDSLDAVYEYICGTNPRDRDSDNNGIPDGYEDFDGDGLINSDEQTYGANPWLADSDDDGLIDGSDVGSLGHPAESLSPVKTRSLYFSGGDDDYVELPKQSRFALQKWTIEAWVQPDADELDGGVVIERWVATNAANYQLGLGDGTIAPTNVPYARFVPNFGRAPVVLAWTQPIPAGAWTHLAASYYNGDLKLFVGGTNVAITTASDSPGVYAGGPVFQTIGRGIKGFVDEVRIWKTNRSAADILKTRDDVLTGLETTLVAYYRFDDSTSYTNGTGFTVGTSANNGTNGTPSSAAWTWGQVEDYLLEFGADWNLQWEHAGSFHGSVAFSTNSAVLPPPQLQIFIEPEEAVIDGAAWSYNGGASWNESGFLETRLTPGPYPISFRILDGWHEPTVTNITMVRGQAIVLTNRYIEAASLIVTLNNDSTIIENARWTIDGGLTWYVSGDRVENLKPGEPGLDIIFSDISGSVPGYDAPDSIHIVLGEGEARIVSTQYEPIRGSVQVSLKPNEILGLATWRISGNTNWQTSGSIVSNLSYGIHSLQFSDVDGWDAPNTEEVSILSGDRILLERTYTIIPEPTSVRTTLIPQEAIDAGAQWRLDGGAWLDSDAVVLVDAGTYLVGFKGIEGWYSPASVSVVVTNERQTKVIGRYGELVEIGGFGTDVGEFKYPRGLAAVGDYLYVTDSGNHRVQVLDIRTIFDPPLVWTNYGGTASGSLAGQFKQPFGIEVDAGGTIWVADSGNYRIQRRDTSGTWTTYGAQGSAVGEFDVPYDVALDSTGAVYVADHHNSRIQKLVLPGTWSEFVPNEEPIPAVRFPAGLALDESNRVYVADSDAALEVNRVRVFDTAGDHVYDVAELDPSGLDTPTGLDFGTNGHLYVASTGSGQINEAVPVMNTNWTIRLPAGILNRPHDVAINSCGNIFIADTENHRVVMLPSDDADCDGESNRREAIAGSNPYDSESVFDIWAEPSTDASGDRIVSWQSRTGRVYTVSILTNILGASWQPVDDYIDVPGIGTEMRYTNSEPLRGVEFYKVRVRVAP